MPNNIIEESVRILSPRPNSTSGTGGLGIGTVVHMLERQQWEGSQDEYTHPTPVLPVDRQRVASLPEYRMIERSRQEERARGGPPAPRNSVDISVITLDDTTDTTESGGDDMYNVTLANEYMRQGHGIEPDPDDVVIWEGVPPVLHVQRTVPTIDWHVYEVDDANANITIDLTDSPPRNSGSNNSPPRQDQGMSPSAATLKCPVCMEPFLAIRQRGSRLVSTTCGHVFCGKCLPACVRTSGRCPTCRNIIGYEDFHPLYLY